MIEPCIRNFLKNCDPDYVDRHSDSSDFETPSKASSIKVKNRTAQPLKDNSNQAKSKTENETFNYQLMVNSFNETTCSVACDKTKVSRKKTHKWKQVTRICSSIQNMTSKRFKKIDDEPSKTIPNYSCEKNFGEYETAANTTYYQPITSLSKHNISNSDLRKIKEYHKSKSFHKKKILCCKHLGKKDKENHDMYSIRPIYIVERNNNGAQQRLCQHSNGSLEPGFSPSDSHIELILTNNSSEMLNADSELEIRRNHKQKGVSAMQSPQQSSKASGYRERNKKLVRNTSQQCPSQSQFSKPYYIYETSCHSKCISTDSGAMGKLTSSSSVFWEFLANKICNKYPKQKERSDGCMCKTILEPCHPGVCGNLREKAYHIEKPLSNTANVYNEKTKNGKKLAKRPPETSKKEKVKCQCYSHKKQPGVKSSNTSANSINAKACQEDHNEVVKSLATKYNGEVLCIHNPPCILINGCLNVPPTTLSSQIDLWPVIKVKNGSFARITKKIKRSKQKNFDQCNQYHPPYPQIEQYLPEFKGNLIRSAYDHNPSCQVLNACYESKYNPELENTSKNVFTCEKQSKHLLQSKGKKHKMCSHDPKCAKVHLCTKKRFVLTAKESKSDVQMKSKLEMVCRHNPCCLMIPKCLTKLVNNNYTRYDAIPDCRHDPHCEMIPACCRKYIINTSPSNFSPASCPIV